MSTLDYLRRKRFINALVADTKLLYKEGDSRSAPNGKTIVMPQYKPDFTEAQDQAFMSELINKCYHAMPDNIADSQQEIDVDKPFGAVFNTVCRHNAQHKRDGMLPGADEYINRASAQESMQFLDILKEHAGQLPPEFEAAKAFDIIVRSKWQSGTDYNIREHLSQEGKEYLDKLLSTPELMDEYLAPRQGGQANVDLTHKLIKEMTNEDNANEMQQEAQSGTGENGEGEGEEGSGEKGSGEGDEQEGEGEGDPKPPAPEAEYQELLRSLKGFSVNEVGQDQTITYPKRTFDGHLEPYKIEEITPNPNNKGYEVRANQVRDAMVDTLSKKVRNVLKVYSQAKYVGGKPRGKLNKKAIASITLGNERIFRKKEIKDVLDTVVCLLVDTSGSMSGHKYTCATAATAMMNECLSSLGIPHAVYGFTTSSNCVIYKHKGFNESKDSDDIIGSMCSGDVYLNGNDDADSVLFAHDQVIRQKQKRKILIVLSDGQPTEPRNAPEYLKKVVGDIEAKSPVEIYGLGILTTSVKDYYSNNVVINSTNQLEDALLNLIKHAIIK